MDNEHNKLGEQYKEAFRDFRQEPSPAVWEKLAQHPALQATPKPSWLSPVKLVIYAAALTTVAVLLYTGLHKSPEVAQQLNSITEPVMITPAPSTNQPAIVENKRLENTTNVQPNAKSDNVENVRLQQDMAAAKNLPSVKGKTLVNAETPVVLPVKPTSSSVFPVSVQPIAQPAKPIHHQNNEPVETANFNTKAGSNPLDISPDTIICKGESSTIWASGGESYLWSTGETLASIIVSPGATTIYSVTLTDAIGTQTIASVEVKVADCQDLYMPNAFTPDGDNLNDRFIIKGENIQSFKMTIFARNGQLVFETNDIYNGWDGQVRGKMGEPGTYTYKINYTDSQGKSHEKKGQLLLLR